MKTLLLSLCFMFCMSLLFAQANRQALRIQEQFSQRHLNYPQEKIYIHHDKEVYLPNESIWFKLYLMDASEHIPSSLSQLAYVELINPQDSIVATRNIHIQEGGGHGDILIDPKWPQGIYTLRAYTAYMRNYDEAFIFQKEIQIQHIFPAIGTTASTYKQKSAPTPTAMVEQASSGKFSIQFFPEGGELIAGISSVLAFKAVDETGNGVAVKGWIKDESGQHIVNFSSLRFGLGFLEFRPQAGKTYIADIQFGDQAHRVELPAIRELGFALKTQTLGKEIVLTVQSNIPNGLQGAFILGHIRGQLFGRIEGMKGSAQRFRLPITDLPNGIAHFTLFTAQGQPVAERLVFIHQPDTYPKLRIRADQPSYGHRQKVELDIELSQQLGQIQAGEFSMSVRDLLIHAPTAAYQDIRSYLLLSSDLKGRIENPAYFFEKDDPARRLLLDLLMLTQGWRRFVWQEVLQDQDPALRFLNEDGFSLSGTVTRLDKSEKKAKADISLTSLSNHFLMDQTTTDHEGRFYFHGYQFEDTTDILLQANLHKEKSKKRDKKLAKGDLGPGGNRNLDIYLDEVDKPVINHQYGFRIMNESEVIKEKIREDKSWLKQLEAEYVGLKQYDLETVVIEARKKKPLFDRFNRSDMLYREPDDRLIIDSILGGSQSTTIFQLLQGRVSGVEIIGRPGIDQAARIRGINSINLNTTATILLDGVAVSTETANNLNVQNVDFIDVLKGLRAGAIYGALGSNGIIAVYTRRGVSAQRLTAKQHGILNIKHPGYYRAREFYMPIYDGKQAEDQQADFRTTLFWAPNLRLDQDGKAHVSFYCSDRTSIYEVQIEGLTSEGQTIVGKYEFEVEKK